MPTIVFTPHLQRFITCPPCNIIATTVANALEQVFTENNQLRSYIVDDQGCLREHVAVFVDNISIKDRLNLSDKVSVNSEIYVLQALSGG